MNNDYVNKTGQVQVEYEYEGFPNFIYKNFNGGYGNYSSVKMSTIQPVRLVTDR